jgi:DNA-binding NarL/FixJ family response regulator
MIRILIVEDNAIVRKGLTMLIGGEPDMEVAAQSINGPEALIHLNTLPVIDIVLADFNMPGMNGVELICRIKAMKYDTKVIILTMHRQTSFRDKAMAAGACGYLLKGEDEQELFEGIRAVHTGGIFVSSGFPV